MRSTIRTFVVIPLVAGGVLGAIYNNVHAPASAIDLGQRYDVDVAFVVAGLIVLGITQLLKA